MPRARTLGAPNAPIDVHTTVNIPPNPATEKPPAPEKPDFFTYMNSLTPEEWKNHIVYLTRENPKTSINGLGGYLTKLQQTFDIEDIKNAYGGYEFSYIMKKGNEVAYSGRFRVESAPKYDPAREQTPAAANGAAKTDLDGNILKVLEQQNERLYQVLTQLQGAKGENPAIGSAIDILTTAYKTGMTTLRENGVTNAGTQNAGQQLEQILSIAERIASIRGGGNSNSLDGLVTLLTTLGVIQKPKTLAEQLTDVKLLQELITGGGDEPKDWKAMLVKMVGEKAPEILDVLRQNAANTAAAVNARRAPVPANGQRLHTVPMNQPEIPPAAAPVAAQPQQTEVRRSGSFEVVSRDDAPAAPAADGFVAPPGPAPAPGSQEEYDAAMKIHCVNMMRMGASGSTIAGFLEDIKPELAKDLVQYSEQMITSYFAQDPILKLMTEDPRWLEVLREAREFLAEEEEPAAKPV